MAATNENALQLQAADVYVATRVPVTALLEDMSNADTVRTELEALTYVRIASVTDVQCAINTSDNVVRVETDDNGTIYTAFRPAATISGNWFEVGEIPALEVVLGISSTLVIGSPNKKLWGTNLATRKLPELIIKIVGKVDENNKNNTIFLYDCGLEGDLVFAFTDIVRAGDLPASPFSFTGNRGGFVLADFERY